MVGFKGIQGCHESLLDGSHVTEDAVAEVFFSHCFPEMLHRIELGTVWWKDHQADILRNPKFLFPCFVCRGSIENEAEELLRIPPGELVEEDLMHGGMHARKDERIHRTIVRAERGESVRIFPNGLLRHIRTYWHWCPAIRWTGDPPEACLILEQNA